MRHLVRLLVTTVTAVLLTAAVVPGVPAQARTWAVPAADPAVDATAELDEFETRVLVRVNKARARRGLRKVRVFHSCVDRTSERWARRLNRTGLLEHRDQTEVLDRCGLSWAGETLARGVGLTPRATVRAWLGSPGHRAVLLKKRARWAGVGAEADSEGRLVAVLNFGDPG